VTRIDAMTGNPIAGDAQIEISERDARAERVSRRIGSGRIAENDLHGGTESDGKGTQGLRNRHGPGRLRHRQIRREEPSREH
jgi:hypothetical protein